MGSVASEHRKRFPTGFGGHTSGTPRLKGEWPDHSAATFPAVCPFGLRISERTCQALHLKTPRKKQFRAVQLCDMWGGTPIHLSVYQ